jgi:hypothetical protein
MIELVRHTLVHRAIDLDIDIVADLVCAEIGGDRYITLLPERTREGIPRARPETVSSWHGDLLWLVLLPLLSLSLSLSLSHRLRLGFGARSYIYVSETL